MVICTDTADGSTEKDSFRRGLEFIYRFEIEFWRSMCLFAILRGCATSLSTHAHINVNERG